MRTFSKKIGYRIVGVGGVLFIFNVLAFVLLFFFLPGRFEENDDIMMCMIANGTMTGMPDCHLVFINAIYGHLLKFLYSTFSGVEWYTILFAIFHIASISAITYQVVANDEWKPICKVVFLIFLYVIWARIIVSFQFTTTAGLLCFAGCLLLLRNNGNSKKFSKSLYLSFLFIITASLIRFSATGLVALIFTPLFLQRCFHDRWYTAILMSVLISVILLQAGDRCFYKGEWKAYREYNAVRGSINDNPNAVRILNKLPDNISSDNYKALLSFVADPSIIGLSELKEIKKLIHGESCLQSIENIKSLTLYRIPLALLAVLLFFAILLVPDKRVLTIHFAILLGLLFVGLSLGATLKNRVFLMMLLPSTYIACDLLKKIRIKQANIIIAGIVLLISSKYVLQTYKTKKVNNYKIELLRAQNLLISKIDGPVYIYDSNYLWEAISPLNIKDNQKIRPICMGWLTNYPIQQVPFKKYTDLIGLPALSILSKNQNSVFPKLIETNYGIEVEEKVINSNETYKLITLVKH